MDFINEDIFAEIISWLPVKSIVQLKCLKKDYNSLISSPYFIKQQLAKSVKRCQKLFLTTTPFLSIDAEKWQAVAVKSDATTSLGYVTIVHEKPIRILGSCHGLICMVFNHEYWIILNPATREFAKIPKPRKTGFRSEAFFGFGYDSSSDDYKLLQGTCFPGTIVVRYPNKLSHSLDIFSFKSCSWRTIEGIQEYRIIGKNRIGTFYDGRIYWLTEKEITPPYRRSNTFHRYDGILSFDLSTEMFHEVIRLPELEYYGEDPFYIQGLSSLGNRLLLYGAAAKRHIVGWTLMEIDGMQTWKMVYKYLVKEQGMPGFTPGAKVWWIKEDGKIVASLCRINRSAMEWYDPSRDEYKHERIKDEKHFVDNCVYMESLVSPRSIFGEKYRYRKKMLRRFDG